jgi:hypothetical protein
MEYWSDGVMERENKRSNGVLETWENGVLEYWRREKGTEYWSIGVLE